MYCASHREETHENVIKRKCDALECITGPSYTKPHSAEVASWIRVKDVHQAKRQARSSASSGAVVAAVETRSTRKHKQWKNRGTSARAERAQRRAASAAHVVPQETVATSVAGEEEEEQGVRDIVSNIVVCAVEYVEN